LQKQWLSGACASALFLGAYSVAIGAAKPADQGKRRSAPQQALVHFRQSAGTGVVVDDVDIDSVKPIGLTGWHRVHSQQRLTAALIAALQQRGDVDAVEPDYEVHLTGTPGDLTAPLWALQNTGQTLENGDRATAGADIGALRAWDLTTGTRQVVVATVDSGVMTTHPDLAANLWSAPAAFTVVLGGTSITCQAGTHGFNALARSCDPTDDNGHGTHVAGSIAATGDNAVGVVGVNWSASVMALKFLDASGNGYVSDAIDAIAFAIQAKQAFQRSGGANVRVLNNSWTGGGYSQALADEIQRANDADMLFVAAAGNESADTAAQPAYPAAYSAANVLTVAATDYRDQLASFSDFGENTVHVGAPGVLIYSTMAPAAGQTAGTYGSMSGTSMAAAYVSGAAALVLAHCPYSTGALRNSLLTTGTVLASLKGRVQSSSRLDAGRAVASCDAALPAPSQDIVVYGTDVAAANRHGAWTLQADATAAGGSALTTVDAGLANTTTALAAPRDYFDVTFAAPANVAYTVWIRMKAAGNSKYNDSVWMQFSDALIGGAPVFALNTAAAAAVNLEPCSGCGVAGWGWENGAYWLAPTAGLTFASSGTHTIRVQTREDGVSVDQIVLSPRNYASAAPGQTTNDATVISKSPAVATAPTARSAGPYGGAPAQIPGTIEAENFDEGGEGASYHDGSAGNSGGAYRSGDVDVEPASSGGYDVGWTSAGEWLNYTVNVAAAGTYTVELRVASSGPGGSVHVELNGAVVGSRLTIPDTGGWQRWQTISTTVAAAAGRQVLRLVMDSAQNGTVGNFDAIVVTRAAAATSAIAVPGAISAADYDRGGEGTSYHDTTAGNSGGAYRQDGVDVEPSRDGGYDVGWIADGEWLNYTVSVPKAGSYVVALRVASPGGGGALHVGFNRVSNVWTPLSVPATAGWQAWTTISLPVTLGAGEQQLTLLFDRGGFNLGTITVSAAP
jgi:thermitase